MINKTPGTLIIYSNKEKIKQAFTVDRPEALPDSIKTPIGDFYKSTYTLKKKEDLKEFNFADFQNFNSTEELIKELADFSDFNRIVEVINKNIKE